MASDAESEPSGIKLRKYSKKARIGRLKKLDGSIKDVPSWGEEPKLVEKMIDQIVKVEKRLGEQTPSLRLVFK